MTPFSSLIAQTQRAFATRHGRKQFLNMLFLAFAFMLVLAPLPLGSNRMWSASLLALWTNVLLLVFLAVWVWQKQLVQTPMHGSLIAATLLLALVVIWVLVQISSWTPAAWHHPLWQEAERVLQQQGFREAASGAIALDSGAAIEHLVRLLGYAAAFWLAYFLALDRDRANILLGIIIASGMIYAAYGFVMEAMNANLVLWYPKRAYIDNMTSTFFNRNSYAAYAGLGLLSATAFVFQRWRQVWRTSMGQQVSSASVHYFFWSDFLTKLASGPLVWGLLPLALFTALILSASRAGFASCMGGLVVLAVGMAINKRVRTGRLLLLVGSAAMLAIFLLTIGGQQLTARLNANTIAEDLPSRLNVYALTWESIKANPWLGYGLGNFDAAFRLFRDTSVIGWFEEAHNDYLEMVMDLGFPAAMLWFAAIGLMVMRCVQGMWQRRRDGIFPVLALAVTAQEALHSIFDFSLQIPAVAMTYAAILGMGVAQSWSSKELDAAR